MAINESIERVFLDTGFVIASSNRRDLYHRRAIELDFHLLTAREIWTTDAVLLEIAAALARPPERSIAIDIWDMFHGGDARYRSIEMSEPHLQQAMTLYRSRPDKAWSLTDCLSFIVMDREGLSDALTAELKAAVTEFKQTYR